MKIPIVLASSFVLAVGGVAAAEPNPDAWWARPGPDGVQRVNIRCGVDFMDPAQIVVRANVPVELAVSAPADLPSHSFTVTLPRVQAPDVDLPVGVAQRRVAFVPALLGAFKAACRDDTLGASDPNAKRKQGALTVIP